VLGGINVEDRPRRVTGQVHRRLVGLTAVVALASAGCGATTTAEGVLFAEEKATTTTAAPTIPEAALSAAAGVAVCLDWSGSVPEPARAGLRSTLAAAVRSLSDGVDPDARHATAGARPLALNVRVVDDNAYGDDVAPNVIVEAHVPGVHEVRVGDPLAAGPSDLPADQLLALTDAFTAAQARRTAEAAARVEAVDAAVAALAGFDRPAARRTDNLGCLSAQAAWLRGRDVAVRRLAVLGDLVNSGGQNLDAGLDGIEVVAVQVCRDASSCIEARDRFENLVASIGGTFAGAVRLDDPTRAAETIVEGLR